MRKVNIGDDRYGASGDDCWKCISSFVGVNGDAHHFTSGLNQLVDLRDSRCSIIGVGASHRLHEDWMVRSNF